MGVIDQIGSMAGTELGKAANLAHETFQSRVGEHGHTGKALVQTFVEMCEKHPNLVGIGVGVMVEQFLVHEKRLHDAHARLAAENGTDVNGSGAHGAATTELGLVHRPAARRAPARAPRHMAHVKPGKIAFEVFGAIVALKFATGVAHVMGRKTHREAWFAPAAKVHLLSGALGAYYLAKAIKAKDLSAWRNAAVALFLTDAIKPVLKLDKKHAAEAAARRAAAPKVVTPAPAAALPAIAAAPAPVAHAPEPEAAHGNGHDASHGNGHAVEAPVETQGSEPAEPAHAHDDGHGDDHSHAPAVH